MSEPTKLVIGTIGLSVLAVGVLIFDQALGAGLF